MSQELRKLRDACNLRLEMEGHLESLKEKEITNEEYVAWLEKIPASMFDIVGAFEDWYNKDD